MASGNPQIGTRIRLARERKHWSQQQLADACGVDVKTIRNWERTGKIRNRQGALEEALGISLGDEQPQATAPSTSAEQAIDRLEAELAQLRQALRERGQGKPQDDQNGGRRAS